MIGYEQWRSLDLSGVRRMGFTAARKLDDRHWPDVDLVLRDLTGLAAVGAHMHEFVTGAAEGGDTHIAKYLEQGCPTKRHRLVVPAAKHNEGLVGLWEHRALIRPTHYIVERVPRIPGPPAAQYHHRDQRIVDTSDFLLGFALHEEHRMPRSGTWATIRKARKAGLPHHVIVLDPIEETLFA